MRLAATAAADIAAVCRHRAEMFRDMGQDDPRRLAEVLRRFRLWVRPRLASGEYLTWLAETRDGTCVAGLGMWILPWPPAYKNPSGRYAYILNVFTEPEHRRRGLARRLCKVALRWCRAQRMGMVVLHASDKGRGVYESLGFQPRTSEMRMLLARQVPSRCPC